MKRSISLFVIAASCLGIAWSQDYVPSVADLNAFLKTKTLVVLEDNPLLEYNMTIKEVVEKEWTLTPYEFIQFKDFESKRKDPSYSFLILTEVRFEKDKTAAKYNFLNLLMGGNFFRINEMPSLVSVPLSYQGVDESGYIYKLGTLIRFMQNHVKLIMDHPDLISSNIFKHYNDNIGDIKTKTLYVIESELANEVNTEKRIKAVYPFKVKIVTPEEVEEAISSKDDNVVFLHKVGPEGTKVKARCYNIIIGAADSKFYYFDYHMIDEKNPDGLLQSDFKKMARK
jgi:hypothetical protein